MTKEQIFTEIQNIVSANPVLVIGSGASVPYNIQIGRASCRERV